MDAGRRMTAAGVTRWLAQLRGHGEFRQRRLKGLLGGVFTSLGNKLLAVLIGFVSVPLTIHYLGTEQYGAWITINAILAWIGLTDLGLSTGLTNALTSAASRDRPDLVRTQLSNFLLLISCLSALALSGFAIAWQFIDWGSVFGVKDPAVLREIRLALSIAGIIFLVRLPIAVANRVYIAYQEGHLGNYWGAAGNILSLVCLILVTRTEGGLPWLVVALTGSVLLVETASLVWLFGFHRPRLRPAPRHVDRRGFGEIMTIGWQFFLIQIMALVTFQTDVLVIAHYLGSASVPRYSVTYQLFNYAALPQALLFPYLWAAYNEAITRGDIGWVRRALRWNLIGGLGWALAAVGFLILIAQPFIGWWAGEAVIPSTALVVLMGTWVLISTLCNAIACLLAAASHLRYQLIYSAFSTLSNLILSILLVTRLGPEGVIGATVISYLIFVCGPACVDAMFLLRRLERDRARQARERLIRTTPNRAD